MPDLGDFLQHAKHSGASRWRRGKPSQKQVLKNSESSTVWIYFASESGTAKGFAHELAIEVKNYGYQANVVDLQSFDPSTFRTHRCVILIVATYGNGEAPSKCKRFELWLDDVRMPRNLLASVHFAVFGLGSREYIDFNAFGRHCDAAMAWFGAKRIHERGEGDETVDTTLDFTVWKGNGLWQALESTLGTQKQRDTKADPIANEGNTSLATDIAELAKWSSCSSTAEVLKVRELRQQPRIDVGESTKHIGLSVDGSTFQWTTAGTLEVLPKNKADDVNWFASRLNVTDRFDVEDVCSLPRGLCFECQKKHTLRDIFSLQCNISGPIELQFVQNLFMLVENLEEREILQTLLRDTCTFRWLASVAQLSLREFIEIFLPSSAIDVSTFLTICPLNRPRRYTIAASRLEDPNRVALCVRMLQHDLPSLADIIDKLRVALKAPSLGSSLNIYHSGRQRYFRGMSSTYLCAGINVGDKIYVRAQASSFLLPSLPSTPIVMVCAGAGVAPFRAFLREFVAEGCSRAYTSLFFGCRHEHSDFLYDSEIKAALTNSGLNPNSSHAPTLSALSLAFSRDTVKAQYVQNQLHVEAAKVKSMFLDGAVIFVCGGRKMGQAVRETISKVIDIDDMVAIKQDGRYIEELW